MKTCSQSIKIFTLASLVLSISLVLFNCSAGSKGDPTPGENISIYIDPSVSTTGDGSIDKPYKYWSEVTFQAGYNYMQKRGTIAREEVIIDASGTSANPMIIGAYGTGADPIIQGSELETGWTLTGGNIYTKTFTGTHVSGMVAEDGTVLKFLKWNSNYTTTFSGATAGSFSIDHTVTPNVIYVWCTGGADPNTRQMEVSRRSRCILVEAVSNITIQNVKIQYASLLGIDIVACGISSTCASGASAGNIIIKNCTVTKCGGVWFDAPYNYHLGNGIQFANGVSNCRVENCAISDIFDSGFTPQVYSNGQNMSGISIYNTTIERCGFAGVEIAALDNLGTTGSISNVTVEKVNVSSSGKGWSGDRSNEYPEMQGIGIKIHADTGSTLTNVKVEQSSVTDCKGHAVWLYGYTGTVTINRTKIFNNDGNGIAAMDIRSGLSLKLILTSSLIYNNPVGLHFNVLHSQGYSLYNNTFYNNNIGLSLHNTNGTARIKNNIFSDSANVHLYCPTPGSDIAFDYNSYKAGGNFMSYNGTTYADLSAFISGTGTIYEANGIQNNPVFTNAASGDFSLQSSSLCRGEGDSGVNVTLDYAGNSFKNPPSIGAYEYY